MSVPACPIPIQKTKLVMSQAQQTGMLFPHTPTPVEIRYPMQKSPNVAAVAVMVKATHHQRGAGCSTTPEIRSVSQLKLRRFRTSGMRAICRSASLISGAACVASIKTMEHRPVACAPKGDVPRCLAKQATCLFGAQTGCLCSDSSCGFLLKTCDAYIRRVRHLRVWIANAREIRSEE